MDTEEGMEVVWNEVRLSQRKTDANKVGGGAGEGWVTVGGVGEIGGVSECGREVICTVSLFSPPPSQGRLEDILSKLIKVKVCVCGGYLPLNMLFIQSLWHLTFSSPPFPSPPLPSFPFCSAS